jgi:hypothetical protein
MATNMEPADLAPGKMFLWVDNTTNFAQQDSSGKSNQASFHPPPQSKFPRFT